MDVAVNTDKLEALRYNYLRSHVWKKYRIDFDTLLAMVDPQAGNSLDSALQLFKPKIEISAFRKIYDTYLGAAFPGSETASKRRMVITRLNKEKLITPENIQGLPPFVQAIAKRCLEEGVEVKLIDRLNNQVKSLSRMKVNDQLCRIYIRSLSFNKEGKPQIFLDIKRSSLRKNKFIFLFCPQLSPDKQLSIIPTRAILNAKEGENIGFTIRVNRVNKRRKKTGINWDKYLNNFPALRRQIKKPQKF
jgi:hypothetical protein